MSKAAWTAALAVAFASGSAVAAGQEMGAYLVIDRTVEELNGQIYPSMSDLAFQGVTNTAVNSMANTPGVSYGQAYGAGVAGGIIAGAIADSAAQAQRNKQIAAVRVPLGDGVLRKAVLTSVDRHLGAAGHPVAKWIVARGAEEATIRRAVGEAAPQEVILFDAEGVPAVMLSVDNRRVLVQAELALYAREKGRYKPQRKAKVAFMSAPAPQETDPIAYWAQDNSRRVLETVDLAIARMVAVATAADFALPEVPKGAQVHVSVDGKGVASPGVLLRQDGDYAYVVTADDWVHIWYAQPAPVESPAAAATTEAVSAQ